MYPQKWTCTPKWKHQGVHVPPNRNMSGHAVYKWHEELLLIPADDLFVWFDSLRPINNLSVIKEPVFLGWTSTKLGLMFLLKDTTLWSRWGSNPPPFCLGYFLESSTLPLSQCAPTSWWITKVLIRLLNMRSLVCTLVVRLHKKGFLTMWLMLNSLGLQIRVCYWKVCFLFLNQNICFGYSKELSLWDGSFEHPEQMYSQSCW